MNFFDFDPDVHDGHMTWSKDLWIFFVIAIPLTTIVLVTWWYWQRSIEKEAKKTNKAHQDTEKAISATLSKSGTSDLSYVHSNGENGRMTCLTQS